MSGLIAAGRRSVQIPPVALAVWNQHGLNTRDRITVFINNAAVDLGCIRADDNLEPSRHGTRDRYSTEHIRLTKPRLFEVSSRRRLPDIQSILARLNVLELESSIRRNASPPGETRTWR